MRLWGRKTEEDRDSRPPVKTHGPAPLVNALLQRFDTDAAIALIHRDWEPSTDDEKMAVAIAMGLYRDLVPFGDACLDAVRRSAERHGWSSGILTALAHIGTVPAITCIKEGLRARWRNGTWDADCARMLALPYARKAMVAELMTGFDPRLLRVLTDAGWQPEDGAERAAYLITIGDTAAAAQIGPEAVGPLVQALDRVGDTCAVLEALGEIGTQEACAAVFEHVRTQWAAGHSRWNDGEMIARFGGKAIKPLLLWMAADPRSASVLQDILNRLMARPELLDDDALQAVATMPDIRHVFYMPEDPRGYEQVVDCSDLRARAAAELEARASRGGTTAR
jgi:hypothetical protein